MPSAATLRIEIEAALAKRIPSALTPAPRTIRQVASTGIAEVDELLHGGLPVGAISEIVGQECSGRTSLALGFLAQITGEGEVGAWIDVTNSLQPESAAAAGVNLSRLLWIRCGVAKAQPSQLRDTAVLPAHYFVPPAVKKGIHGGGCGSHPRGEVKGLSNAVDMLLRPEAMAARCTEPQRRERPQRENYEPVKLRLDDRARCISPRPLTRIEQALRVTDLLLQAGGFSAIVLDMGGVLPEHAVRVPSATWFRYRAAAERTHASILLLTQHACAKSSAGLVLRMLPGKPREDEQTVFTGIQHKVEVVRERFAATPTNVIPLRKPPQSERQACWQTSATWTGVR